MRQYTSNGRIPGYADPLDLNYFRGTIAQWNKYANPGNTTVTPTPQPSRPGTGSGYSVVVRSGDAISGIAARTGLWPVTAWSVPSGDINRIWPGQTVTYRGRRHADRERRHRHADPRRQERGDLERHLRRFRLATRRPAQWVEEPEPHLSRTAAALLDGR